MQKTILETATHLIASEGAEKRPKSAKNEKKINISRTKNANITTYIPQQA